MKKIALIIGAGDATGAAIARKFASEGFVVCLVRRDTKKLNALVENIKNEGGEAYGFACDARKEEEVNTLFETIAKLGELGVFVFNIGANVPSSILNETPRKYFKIWELACFSGFLTAKAAAKAMVKNGKGTIIFTGATASLRGSANFAAFAGAKHALRALAQAMARELSPLGIHVAHVVIDGAIDTAFIRDNFPQKYALKDQDGILNPDHIAQNYWHIHQQPRDAWTFEMDLRPFSEKF